MLVDSHCHLNFPDFAQDFPQIVANAQEAGVSCLQTICTTQAEFPQVRAIAEQYEHIYCSVGVHPNEVANEELATVDWLVEQAHHSKVIGIGETGLDYHYENSPRELQRESFIRHIAAARITQLPLIVHTRNADADTVEILQQEMAKGKFPALIHCFSASAELAEACIAMGIYISISGIITFKSAKEIQQTVKQLPLDMLLVETDAPYLAPIPKRGKRNEPAYVRHTAQYIADLRSISLEECASATTANFYRLFSKANSVLAA
jgi:TatD DNase family protein